MDDPTLRCLTGCNWYLHATYTSVVDPQSYGFSYGALRRCMTGGPWDQSKDRHGSRTMQSHCFPSRYNDNMATRGCKHSNNYPGATMHPEYKRFNGYPGPIEDSVYDSAIDPKSYGMYQGLIRRNMCGQTYVYPAERQGSRSGCGMDYSAYSNDHITTRGCNKREVSPQSTSGHHYIHI